MHTYHLKNIIEYFFGSPLYNYENKKSNQCIELNKNIQFF